MLYSQKLFLNCLKKKLISVEECGISYHLRAPRSDDHPFRTRFRLVGVILPKQSRRSCSHHQTPLSHLSEQRSYQYLALSIPLPDSKMGNESEKVKEANEGEEEIVCLESFFINDDYQLTTFTFGSHVLELYCLQSASTDFDLTGQLVWPGAMLMNGYLSENADILQGCSVLELGSGVGITGVLCSKFCRKVIFTDHNDEVLKILKKNIDKHSGGPDPSAELEAAKLEWGNSDHLGEILKKHNDGFDLILGADICFQQSSVPLLFDSVEQLLRIRGHGNCKFILAYVSRARQMDSAILREGAQHKMLMNEVSGTRCTVGNLEGVIYEITLQ